MVSLRKDHAPVDLDLQLADYVRSLTKYEPRDVEAACLGWVERKRSKFFPVLAELLDYLDEIVATRKQRAEARQLAPAADQWGTDYRVLGPGLSVARGQCVMRADVPAARERFNRMVEALGMGRAKELADKMFRAGSGYGTILDDLEEEAGTAPVKRAANMNDEFSPESGLVAAE